MYGSRLPRPCYRLQKQWPYHPFYNAASGQDCILSQAVE
uniref:Uncharacterized protein n=1 Tax=Anguilla anguilla TaxID=7936 RepID=A0A0E9PNL0_ANGAN